MTEVECAEQKCDYPEPHDHGFACGPFCPCSEGMQAAKWAGFEADATAPEPDVTQSPDA